MCGINGIVGRGSDSYAEEVSRMNNALSHRGPDDHGLYSEEGIALGHRRLSIIDLSENGHQPMSSHTGRTVVVFNGEIYNFKEVKTELDDYPFRSSTDTEMILAAYEKWGDECFTKFNGMFAIAIWNIEEKKLILARDRLGIKPLYYYRDQEKIIFSSEVRGILESGLIKRKLDSRRLAEYFEYQTVHAPNTIVKDVQMLMPGNILTWSGGKYGIGEYWSLTEIRSSEGDDPERVKKDIRNEFFQAVERRLMADVPLGAFLSGGIDSSAVVAAMKVVSDQKISTFNVSFDESEFSEAHYAKKIADIYGTDHHEIRLKPEDFVKDLPRALHSMDHPSGDGPNSYVVCEATKKEGITVALSGLGGDELFCGYSVFGLLYKLQNSSVRKLPYGFRKILGKLIFALKRSNGTLKIKEILSKEQLDLLSAYPLFRQALWREEIEKLNVGYDILAIPKILSLELENEHLYSAISRAEISTYMQNVLLRDTDQMSMAHSLEVRVPFLDHNLVEKVLSLGDSLKHPYTPKKLLTDAIGDMLPSEITQRKKMGFTLPWESWMKNELRDYCEEGIEHLKELKNLNSDAVKELWGRFLRGEKLYTWSRVWPLVVLGHWTKTNKINE